MIEVFDMNDLPGLRLSARKMICLHAHMNNSEAIHVVRNDLARGLAKKVLETDSFLWSRCGNIQGLSTLEYGIDCIILTPSEYEDLRRKAFSDGVYHARGFVQFPIGVDECTD